MAFTNNSGYATGTGDPNSDVTIKDGGGNIPTIYVDTTPTPVVVYKFDSTQVSGSKWLPMEASPDAYRIMSDVANNVGAILAISTNWYVLDISSAVTSAGVLVSETTDVITVDNLHDDVYTVTFRGILDTSALSVSTGVISLRIVLNETALAYTTTGVLDNATGVIELTLALPLALVDGDDIKFELSSTGSTGTVSFDNVHIGVSN